MGRVEGKVVIVTGGGSGIGAAEVRVLAGEGAQVVVTDVDVAAGRRVADDVGGLFVEQDVSREASWSALIEETQATYSRLDALINNAGIGLVADIENTTSEIWRRVISVNLDAVFYGCKYAIEAMKETGGGSIVNTSSIAALKGVGPYFAYSAAKGGVRSLTRSVAHHCKLQGYGIRCNSIYPGGVETPMLDSMSATGSDGRPLDPEQAQRRKARVDSAQPDDIAQLVLYLVSDESRHVNGAEMVIDAGATAF